MDKRFFTASIKNKAEFLDEAIGLIDSKCFFKK
jgi:hypothetical protein